MKEKKKNNNGNKFQDLLDTINENPFSYFLKPLNNVKDFPNKVVIGIENYWKVHLMIIKNLDIKKPLTINTSYSLSMGFCFL